MFPKAIVLLLALITGTAVTCGSVPIIVSRGAGRRATGNLVNTGESQLKMGDLAGAKRNVDVALQIDPEFWPALYTRAKIFAKQDQYELAIQDCNQALRQYRGFVEAALLRAGMNTRLRKYRGSFKGV
jgi:Tfp pilus assembly protein PilF